MQQPQQTRDPEKPQAGARALILFGMPFVLVGLLAIGWAVVGLAEGKQRDGLGLLVAGVLFGGAGAVVIALGVMGKRQAAHEAQLREQFPGQPWRYREAWASGEIKSTGRATMIGAWVFATFWNLISSILFGVIPAELAKGNHKVLIALAFPLAGLGLLAWAVHATLRWRRFGPSVFKMTTAPGVIGGHLAGVVRAEKPLGHLGDVTVRLAGIRRQRQGKHTHETTLWMDEKVMRPEVTAAGGGGIPVYFFIPYSCEPSSETAGEDGVVTWRLTVESQMPGVDYRAEFEVPVFRTEQSRPEAVPGPDPTASFQAPVDPLLAPANARVNIRESVGGGREFLVPARRSVGALVGTAVVLLMLGGAIWGLVHFRAPVFFLGIAGLFGLIVVWATVESLFKEVTVVIEPSGVVIRSQRLGIAATRRTTFAEVAGFDTEMGLQSGSKMYYRVVLLLATGRRLTVSGVFPDKREADWLAGQMRAAWEAMRTKGRG